LGLSNGLSFVHRGEQRPSIAKRDEKGFLPRLKKVIKESLAFEPGSVDGVGRRDAEIRLREWFVKT